MNAIPCRHCQKRYVCLTGNREFVGSQKCQIMIDYRERMNDTTRIRTTMDSLLDCPYCGRVNAMEYQYSD